MSWSKLLRKIKQKIKRTEEVKCTSCGKKLIIRIRTKELPVGVHESHYCADCLNTTRFLI